MAHYSDFYHQRDAENRLKSAKRNLAKAEERLDGAPDFMVPYAMDEVTEAQKELDAAQRDYDSW